MKEIYLTSKGEQEIQAKIAELEKQLNSPNHFPMALSGKLLCLKEILSSATILPVEESWDKAVPDGIEEDIIFDYIQDKFKYGVIIQPKH